MVESQDHNEWFEIQDNIAYFKEFEITKIVWGNLATEPKFAFDLTSSYVSAPANIIPTNDLYLLAVLNSPLCKWWISLQAAVRSGGFLEYKPMYVGTVPVKPATDNQKAPIIERVKQILANPDSPDVQRLEAEINQMVYKLYDLTPDEIAIVEGEGVNSYAD
jgi:adenine-specific DNA-methyltransferase